MYLRRSYMFDLKRHSSAQNGNGNRIQTGPLHLSIGQPASGPRAMIESFFPKCEIRDAPIEWDGEASSYIGYNANEPGGRTTRLFAFLTAQDGWRQSLAGSVHVAPLQQSEGTIGGMTPLAADVGKEHILRRKLR